MEVVLITVRDCIRGLAIGLRALRSRPWLVQVRLLYAFQDSEHVYLARDSEYAPGGDFCILLNNSDVLILYHDVQEKSRICVSTLVRNFYLFKMTHSFHQVTETATPYDTLLWLDKVKDIRVIHRSTIERRSIYRFIRNENPRYADSFVGSPDYMASRHCMVQNFNHTSCLPVQVLPGTRGFRHKRFYEVNHAHHVQSTIGRLVASCLSSLLVSHLLVVVHLIMLD
jgi:hypothetical protein